MSPLWFLIAGHILTGARSTTLSGPSYRPTTGSNYGGGGGGFGPAVSAFGAPAPSAFGAGHAFGGMTGYGAPGFGQISGAHAPSGFGMGAPFGGGYGGMGGSTMLSSSAGFALNSYPSSSPVNVDDDCSFRFVLRWARDLWVDGVVAVYVRLCFRM